MDRIARAWRVLIVALSFALCTAVMNGGAQEARAQTASDTAPAEDQVAEDQFSDVSAALNLWAKQVKLLEEAVADEQAPDDVLREAPARLESLRSEIIALTERLRPKFVEAKDRLNPEDTETVKNLLGHAWTKTTAIYVGPQAGVPGKPTIAS